tara:strand:+ start:1022 stop:1468 length:447 start_codon:yes stop_codon:yes gene_type:complete
MIQQLHVNSPAKAVKLNGLYHTLQHRKTNTILLVKYYLDGCPACIHFQPAWKKTIPLAKKLKDLPNVVFVEVNEKMLKHVDIPQVHQYPTIKLFNFINPQGIDFNQERTPENLLHFIKQYTDKIVKRRRRRRTRRCTRRRNRQSRKRY